MKRILSAATALLYLGTLSAMAEDRRHVYKDVGGKTFEGPWWDTLAYCAGRLKVLGEWAETAKRPDAQAVKDAMNIHFALSVNRLMVDRGIPQQEALDTAGEVARGAIDSQRSAVFTYMATRTMDQEFENKVMICDTHLRAYAEEFPGDFKASN